MVSQTLGKPVYVTIIQVYAPTTEAEEEIENFYTNIKKKDHTPKQDLLIIIGDWNSKVGNITESNVIRKFGLWVRNED